MNQGSKGKFLLRETRDDKNGTERSNEDKQGKREKASFVKRATRSDGLVSKPKKEKKINHRSKEGSEEVDV